MWRCVVIGEGNWGTGAVGGDYPNLTENHTSYWISDVFERMGMTIFKDTPEGQHITKLIEENSSPEVVKQFIQDLFFTRVPVDKLKAAIEARIARAFADGKRAKVEEIRQVLGL